MIDTHLIYMALTIFGVCAGTAILISAAIITIAAVRLHRTGTSGSTAGPRRARPVHREPALR